MNNYRTFQIENFTILSLIFYMENAQLISKKQKMDNLYLTLKIVDLSIIALNFFLKENLVAFDAQVGENLCQIRAYRILNLAKKWLHKLLMKHEFQKQIDKLIKYRAHLQNVVAEWEQAIQLSKCFNKNLDGIENIADFFARHDLAFDLNEEMVFIIACYFLTRFNIRVDNIPVAINLKQIADELTISKHKAKRLSHHYQQLICQLGCEFIMQIASELPSKYSHMEILPSLYKIADENRTVLPCHIVSEILFNHAIQEKVPVLLKVTRFCPTRTTPYDTILFLLLGDKENKNQFSLIPCNLNFPRNCLVVSGEAHDPEGNTRETTKNYITRFLKETPLKLILANTAIHPQYSGKRLEAFKDNPFIAILADSKLASCEKLEKNLALMRRFAFNTGCSQQTPTTFLLRHVYANILENELNDLSSTHTGCAYKVIGKKYLLSSPTGVVYGKTEPIIDKYARLA
ncbi:MAG: hypothetical protein H0U70_09090 [Tatlockia sp.]|nr:hypothetical protein [Tatlockia sp.]